MSNSVYIPIPESEFRINRFNDLKKSFGSHVELNKIFPEHLFNELNMHLRWLIENGFVDGSFQMYGVVNPNTPFPKVGTMNPEEERRMKNNSLLLKKALEHMPTSQFSKISFSFEKDIIQISQFLKDQLLFSNEKIDEIIEALITSDFMVLFAKYDNSAEWERVKDIHEALEDNEELSKGADNCILKNGRGETYLKITDKKSFIEFSYSNKNQ